MSYTVAPWVYCAKRQRVTAENGEQLIADIRGWGRLSYLPNGEQIQDANGRLVAAAPELLAALESLVAKNAIYHRLNNNHEWVLSKHQPDGMQHAIDLIAKVKGGSDCQNCVHANQGACCGGVR